MNEEFDGLERQLRQTLRRRDPSPGFAARVVAAAERPRGVSVPIRARWWMAAAAAVLAVLGGLGVRDYQRGLEAKQQLLTALSITSEKLNAAEQKIEQIQQRSLNR